MTWRDDAEFECLLEEGMEDIVPTGESVETVNPWHMPISYITWGLILTSFNLGFAYLQYILPTVGVALLYVGFRSLIGENRYFNAAWLISAVRLLWQVVWLISVATPWLPWANDNLFLGLLAVGLELVLFLFFRAGLKEVYQKAGTKQERDPLLWAVIWLLAITACAFSPLANTWLAFFAIGGSFFLLVRSIYHVGGELGSAGYCLTPASVRVSGNVIVWGYVVFCLLLALVCNIAATSAWPEFIASPAITESDAREKLVELGFPEEVLRDVSDKNIVLLAEAQQVQTGGETMVLPGGDELKITDI